MRIRPMISILCLVLLLAAISLVQASQPHVLPAGLGASAWAQMKAQIRARQYDAYAEDNGTVKAINPAQGFHIEYRRDGQTRISPSGPHPANQGIGLKLVGYGYGESFIVPESAPALSANAHTVTYQWKPTLREWWINSPDGLEQWFELAEPPALAAHGQPLVLAMCLDTKLNATIKDNALRLESTDGATITYDRLKVWDATGTVLPASMHLDQNRLALHVDDSNAVYPVTIDPTFAQQAYLKASNADPDDQFSFRIALDGDTAVVSAPLESSTDAGSPDDNSVFASGAVYVFVRDSVGQWSEQGVLKASNANAEDLFGYSVAVSGDTIVVGAILEDSNSRVINAGQEINTFQDFGAVYVFERDGSGVWIEQAYLKPTNTNLFSQFGFSVDIDGDTIAVGANLEDSGLDGVFNGDDAIGIGTDFGAFDSGSAYVFVRDDTGVWTQQAYIKAAISDAGDQFGTHVALDGETLVVGASGEASNSRTIINGPGADTDNSQSNVGAAYVFVRDHSGVWSQQAYIKAANADNDDRFGLWLDVDGDSLAVGALSDDSNAVGVFGGDGFPEAANNLAINSGAVYMFERDASGNWTQDAYIKASNTGSVDQFGIGLDLKGDLLVVGANSDDSSATGPNLDLPDQQDNSATEAGAAFVFQRDINGAWSQISYLKPSNTQTFDEFGARVAISGTTILASSIGDDSSARGVFNDSAPVEAINNENADPKDGFSGLTGAAFIFDMADFSIGGTVTGLVGSGLVLQNNGGDDLAVTADGSFTFMTRLMDNASYAVTVLTQPTNPSQTCSVSNGVGELGGLDITNVDISCETNTFTVGGNVSGLVGAPLVLQNNGGDDLFLFDNGSFTFATSLPDLSGFSVTVSNQPAEPNQTCTVSNGAGMLDGEDVTNVEVICETKTFTIGGTVTGLEPGNSVELVNNGVDNQLINSDGVFTFPLPLSDGSTYSVTVSSQPTEPSQTCTVTNGSGTVMGADVTNIQVACSVNQFPIGGAVSGLNGSGLVLQNNGGDDLAISVDGAFTFVTPLDDGSAYQVTVAAQPNDLSQTCTVSNGDGILNGMEVSDVQVTCITNQFTIGGMVTGLNANGLVLQNNGGDDLAVTVDGGFTFATALDDGSNYAVTILSQPGTLRDQVCTVSNGSGTLAAANVENVIVNCADIVLSLSANDLDLGSIELGGNSSGTIAISNTGIPDLTIDSIGSPTDPFSLIGGTCLILPVTLAAGEVCTIAVGFNPTAVGAFSDQLVMTSNATSSPDTVTVRGRSLFEPLIVPVLSAWGLLVLIVAMLLGAVWARRRTARRT